MGISNFRRDDVLNLLNVANCPIVKNHRSYQTSTFYEFYILKNVVRLYIHFLDRMEKGNRIEGQTGILIYGCPIVIKRTADTTPHNFLPKEIRDLIFKDVEDNPLKEVFQDLYR